MSAPASTTAAIVDGVDVDAVAAAVLACPGVSGLYGGRGDTIASYLPGRRVAGVEVISRRTVVHVRSRWAVPASELLKEISAALRTVIGSGPFEVVVADIDDPPPAVQASRVERTPAAAALAGSVPPAEHRRPGSGPPPTGTGGVANNLNRM